MTVHPVAEHPRHSIYVPELRFLTLLHELPPAPSSPTRLHMPAHTLLCWEATAGGLCPRPQRNLPGRPALACSSRQLLQRSLCCVVSPVRWAVLSRRVPHSGRRRAGTPQQAHRRMRRLPLLTGATLASALSFRSRSWPSDGLGLHGTRFWRASLRSDSERVACGQLAAGSVLHTCVKQSNLRNRIYGHVRLGIALRVSPLHSRHHLLRRRSSGPALPLQHPFRPRPGPSPWRDVTWLPSPRQVRPGVGATKSAVT